MTYEEAKNTIEEKYEAEKMECTCSHCKKCASIKLHTVKEAEIVVDVYEIVRKILLNSPDVKIEDINKDTNFREDLCLRCFDIFFLLQEIEIECNVNLTTVSEFFNQLTTVGDMVNFIIEKMKKQKGEKGV